MIRPRHPNSGIALLAPKIGQSIRDLGLLSPSIRNSIITLTVIATVVSVIMAMNAGSVVAVLLQRGAFTAQNTIETASIVRIHVLSLGPLVLALILTQVVIQVGGQRWLIPIAGIKLAVKAACLFALLSFSVGIAALPISFIVSEVATAGLLLFAMWRRR